ncbi:MAG: DUF4040 domain-containing protein [Bacillota bacterium]|nr:DUF4040 domain-containing protein [Bacillota bacterium]
MTEVVLVVCLTFLILCAIAVALAKDLLSAVVLFGAFSLLMSVVWQILNAPDIAITEAAVGVSSTVLMIGVVAHVKRRRNV